MESSGSTIVIRKICLRKQLVSWPVALVLGNRYSDFINKPYTPRALKRGCAAMGTIHIAMAFQEVDNIYYGQKKRTTTKRRFG